MSDFVRLAWTVEVASQPIERFTCQGMKTQAVQSPTEGSLHCSMVWRPLLHLEGCSPRDGEDLNLIPDITFSKSNNKSVAIMCASAPPICIMSVMILIYPTGVLRVSSVH